MRILALITARGGSKRVPGKNIRLLAGKPLVAWSIDVAKNIPEICDILVSTEDPQIAEVCTQHGALVPWLRPAELATDTATSDDVAVHALDWYESERGVVDGLLLLQPTSPFRTKETVVKGLELFRANSLVPVVGVSLARSHPMWTFKQSGDQLEPYLEEHGFGKRSQDLPDAFAANGCLYVISPKLLRLNRSFVGATVQPLFVASMSESIDIDTEEDWEFAQGFARGLSNSPSSQNSCSGADSNLNELTAAYIRENEAAFAVEQRTLVYEGQPRKVLIESLRSLAKLKFKNATLGTARYVRDLLRHSGEIKKLSAIKGSKKGKRAIVIGNGPSQGLISSKMLQKFTDAENDVFSVNFWSQNAELSIVAPQYLVISDPSTLTESKINGSYSKYLIDSGKALKAYLLEHQNIILVAPADQLNNLKDIFGVHRVLGFIDTDMRWISSNIDPRMPRGYLSMTLFKALALAIHMGYDQIYLVGMDNTYPRDIFCDEKNRILNYERHAATADYLIDVSSQIPTMDVWAQDIFQLFHDLRRCFSGTKVLNLDCYSLTDVFPKIAHYCEIERLLSES
jgi:CMP-N,N'-diacetyllegionaminic acid synthase